ncbi:VOC family protein [Alkalihalobacillus sp. MEB130]|uniref:VOC family protein n=1 Tax=Alkalihalobacillus sp. MEB130 TaxID=2976704 RepID=UPI0028E01CEC|nr:VOC family protein [Alkalihalobacillus sp. MEB130]MDT8861328.1 VOC family protein [Alkalihalobacillus sp. MEB130]
MGFQLHPDTELGSVQLKVSNLERSLVFYEQIIGLTILTRNEDVVQLTADGKEPLLILQEEPNAQIYPPNSTLGLYHVAILLPERKNLGAFLKHVIEHRLEIGSADHFVSEAIYLADPDHNGLEIYWDRPKTGWIKVDDTNYKMVTERIDGEGLIREAGNLTWKGLPEKTKIGHVHFHVHDLAESKEFYKQLGFDVTVGNMTKMGMLFLAAGGYHHHIGLNVWAGPNAISRANSVGISYYTIVLPTREEWLKLIRQLKGNGIPILEENDKQCFVQDPTGIAIRLIGKE